MPLGGNAGGLLAIAGETAIVPFAVLFFTGLLFLDAQVTGWNRLAKRFPAMAESAGVYRHQNGGVGAIGVYYGMSVLGASAAGFASGVFFGAIVFFFASFLYGQQASTRVQSGEMVGKSARVVVAIPAGGLGQVRLQLGEEMIDKVAKAKDGSAIAFNSVVKIEEEIGEIVLVRPL